MTERHGCQTAGKEIEAIRIDRSTPGSRWADRRATACHGAPSGRPCQEWGRRAPHVRRAADRFQCPEERIEPVAAHGSALASRDRSPTFLLAAVAADWFCGAGLCQADHACRGRGPAQAESVVDPHSIATYWNINRELDSGQGAPCGPSSMATGNSRATAIAPSLIPAVVLPARNRGAAAGAQKESVNSALLSRD